MSDQSALGGLADEIVQSGSSGSMMRLGKVTVISGGATPPTITVDGRVMRFLGAAAGYTVGKIVVYWNEGQPICLGQIT